MRNTSKIKDLTGMKFNKLTVIGIASEILYIGSANATVETPQK